MSQTLVQNYDEFERLKTSFQKELPLLSDTSLKIPYNYGPFPKNLMDEAIKVNEKFLNKWQGIIEEYLPKVELQLFVAYQNKYFSKFAQSENFKESLFRKCKCKTKRQIRDIILQSMTLQSFGIAEPKLDHLDFLGNIFFGNHGNAFISFAVACTPGADLLGNSDTSTNSGGLNGNIYGSKDTGGVIGECYDQLAQNLNAAAGNERLGIYDESGGNPNNVLEETGSVASTTGFNFRSVTEFDLLTTINYVCAQSDNSGNDVFGKSSIARPTKAQSYGFFTTGVTEATGTGWNTKAGHT